MTFLNKQFDVKKVWLQGNKKSDSKQAPGLDIHEMGGARMGEDPNIAITNAFNQLHDCKNVFVTDGACMTLRDQKPFSYFHGYICSSSKFCR